MILSVLFAAAARISAIHETCGRLANAPREETFTAALYPQRRPFLMPMVCHDRKTDHPSGPSASNVFKARRTSEWDTYTLQDGKQAKATVLVCVKRARFRNQHGKRKSETWVYAYWAITPKRVDWAKETYRRRSGIETSYRQMNRCRIRTTTKKSQVRFLYLAIG